MTEPPGNDDHQPVSKTRRKKDMHALQALGEALVALTPAQLSGLDLPERLADAIAQARRIPTFEARRRQMQYIGRLMREVDAEPIAQRLSLMRNERRRDNARHHEAERWRERLLAEDSVLTELAATHPGLDTQHLHTLVRNARRELARGDPPKANRALFRALRDCLGDPSAGESGGADIG
ncbi:MAG: ribosome biogenesis factor YjgA [Burkholderiales bacterium]